MTTATVVMLGTGVMPVLSSCGREPQRVEPRAWAVSICRAVGPWNQELRQLRNHLADGDPDPAGIPRVKVRLITRLAGMVLATDTAITQVQAAGLPETDGGDQIAARFVEALRTARRSFAEGRDAVAALPTDDPATFHRGVTDVRGRVAPSDRNANGSLADFSARRPDPAVEAFSRCQSS